VVEDASGATSDVIHYEDGKVEKKQYGDVMNPDEAVQLFVHLIERGSQTVRTVITHVDKALTLSDFCTLLSEKAKIAINNP
jgi:hypothetical protein